MNVLSRLSKQVLARRAPDLLNEWTGIKITDVGISRDTPQLFCDLLLRHNRQRRVALTPMDLWIKFHQQITFPRVLADRSVTSLVSMCG